MREPVKIIGTQDPEGHVGMTLLFYPEDIAALKLAGDTVTVFLKHGVPPAIMHAGEENWGMLLESFKQGRNIHHD